MQTQYAAFLKTTHANYLMYHMIPEGYLNLKLPHAFLGISSTYTSAELWRFGSRSQASHCVEQNLTYAEVVASDLMATRDSHNIITKKQNDQLQWACTSFLPAITHSSILCSHSDEVQGCHTTQRIWLIMDILDVCKLAGLAAGSRPFYST